MSKSAKFKPIIETLRSSISDRWELGPELQSRLWGRDHQVKRLIATFRVHEALFSLFGNNHEIEKGWIREPRESLDHRSPLDIMSNDGLLGIERVANYLDWVCNRC